MSFTSDLINKRRQLNLDPKFRDASKQPDSPSNQSRSFTGNVLAHRRKSVSDTPIPAFRQPERVSEPEEKQPGFIRSFASEVKKTVKPSLRNILSTLKSSFLLSSRLVPDVITDLQAVNIYQKVRGRDPLTDKQKDFVTQLSKEKDERMDRLIQNSIKGDQLAIRKWQQANPTGVEDKPFLEKIRDPEFIAQGFTMGIPTIALSTIGAILAGPPGAIAPAFVLESGGFYQDALDDGV